MSDFYDDEFGEIVIVRSKRSRSIKVSVSTTGRLKLNVPKYTPVFMIKRMIGAKRRELQSLLEQQPKFTPLNGMAIGKSYTLIIRYGSSFNLKMSNNQLIVTITDDAELHSKSLNDAIRTKIRMLIRREAKNYLPKRLIYLAKLHGYTYQNIRFTHAGTRWGSCSSRGTISLNIALMNLPYALIDYVLIHELAHTKQMNHSSLFWQLVEQACPDFKSYKTALKQHNPII